MEMRGKLLPTARVRAIQEEIAWISARPGHRSQRRIPLQDLAVMPCICNDPQIVGEIVYTKLYILYVNGRRTYEKFDLYIYMHNVYSM